LIDRPRMHISVSSVSEKRCDTNVSLYVMSCHVLPSKAMPFNVCRWVGARLRDRVKRCACVAARVRYPPTRVFPLPTSTSEAETPRRAGENTCRTHELISCLRGEGGARGEGNTLFPPARRMFETVRKPWSLASPRPGPARFSWTHKFVTDPVPVRFGMSQVDIYVDVATHAPVLATATPIPSTTAPSAPPIPSTPTPTAAAATPYPAAASPVSTPAPTVLL